MAWSAYTTNACELKDMALVEKYFNLSYYGV
jgi:hypothetical protein